MQESRLLGPRTSLLLQVHYGAVGLGSTSSIALPPPALSARPRTRGPRMIHSIPDGHHGNRALCRPCWEAEAEAAGSHRSRDFGCSQGTSSPAWTVLALRDRDRGQGAEPAWAEQGQRCGMRPQ